MTVSTSTASEESMNHTTVKRQQSLPQDSPAPRLCHLVKWSDFDGYGFNLHADKSKSGQFVGKVDENSPAQSAGLREGDRIIEVNGVNIANENHRQVVERIKAIPNETKLLVIDEAGDSWYKSRSLIVKGTQENVVFLKTTRSEKPPVTDGEDGEDRLKVESQSIKEPKNLTAPASANLCSEVEGEEVTTEPIPDLVLNGVHEDDDECDRQKEQVKVPNEVERSAETPAVDSTSSQKEEESTLAAVKAEEIAVESTPDTHLNSETLGEVESSPLPPSPSSSSSSSNNSTSVTPTVIVLPEAKTSSSPSSTHLTSEKTENLACKQDQIGEETAKVVLGEEVETSPSPNESSSSNNEQVEETVNKITNNNTFNQHNNNNTLNEANNNHSSPKVEMKSETNEQVSTPNGVPINATVTVASKLPSNGIIINGGGDIHTTDVKDSAGDSIPASPTSIKSVASSNASSNGGSSTGGSLTNGTTGGYKRSSLTGIIDPNLEMSLNMSVSEMRQFLAQKKKQDPKKLPMDLKQKYEIISSM